MIKEITHQQALEWIAKQDMKDWHKDFNEWKKHLLVSWTNVKKFYKSKNNIDKKDLIKKSDIIILSAPHKAYKKLKIGNNKTLIDVWGLIDKS